MLFKIFTTFALLFLITITVLTPMTLAQGISLKDFNPFGSGGISCLYYFKTGNTNTKCTEETGLLNRIEGLLLNLSPALAVVGIMLGGYNMMQEGYEAKGKGIKLVQGSIVGLLIVVSARFVRDLSFTVLNGTFNASGATASTINNAGVQAILKILRTVAYDILVPIGTPVAVGFVIWGGYQLITAGGDAKKVATGIQAIRNAIIGFLVIVFAAAIISISQNIFGGLLGTIK
jgi:hypothetical protein